MFYGAVYILYVYVRCHFEKKFALHEYLIIDDDDDDVFQIFIELLPLPPLPRPYPINNKYVGGECFA